jgi:hypothetical protein
MIRIALRMIFGARGRYATLVLGLAFAVLLAHNRSRSCWASYDARPDHFRMSVSPTCGWCRAIHSLSIISVTCTTVNSCASGRSRGSSGPSRSLPSGASPIFRMDDIST